MTNLQNKFAGKRVAILRGYPRLIDGESTSVEEMWKWGVKNDVQFHTFYLVKEYKAKSKIGKQVQFKDGYKHEYTTFNKSECDKIAELINTEYDLVILVNPAKYYPKLGLTNVDIVAFKDMYAKINVLKVNTQHNSFSATYKKMPFLWSYLNNSDIIMNHDKDSYYLKSVAQALPSKRHRTYPMQLWNDVLQHKDYFKNEERRNTVTYIGRFSIYKGPTLLLKYAEAIHAKGLLPEIYGMDASRGCLDFIFTHDNCNDKFHKKPIETANPIVDTYGLMPRDEVIKTFHKSLFAWTPFRFSGKESTSYGNRLEYSMQEAICAGAILVVHKEWADKCTTKDGVRYSDIKHFAVILDEDNPAATVNQMAHIARDKDLQHKYRETAFRVLAEQYDSSIVIPELLELMLSATKDPYKFDSDKQIVKYFTKSDELADLFEHYVNVEGKIIPMAPGVLEEDKLCVFGGAWGRRAVTYQEYEKSKKEQG
ncbi:glycosyltransferase [Priestia megaterium]|uniref:glycosyltransferase n=1 Tax=Priestia megaterium TaxID=1404 RepID=UPI000BEB4B3E|nr:glycosyltransferase [Priestia megaterium]PED64023.1 hypothetical protein CON20_23965 [Priestia megaterium]